MNRKNLPDVVYAAAAAACFLACAAVVYAASGFSPLAHNYYNSYTLQALRWLSGHLDLGQNYAHLEIAEYGGKFFVSFPPFPSVVMLPFAAVFGEDTPDNAVALGFGLLAAVYAYRLCALFVTDRRKALFLALFATAASNYMHVALWGSVWYIAQNMAFGFTLTALFYTLSGGRAARAAGLALLACAVGCRPFHIVYAPLLLYIVWERGREGKTLRAGLLDTLKLSAPAICAGLGYAALNLARFGNPLQFGHDYLPEFAEQHKQFSLSYVWPNLMTTLFKLPKVIDGALVFPEFDGVAFWIVSPIALAGAGYFVYGLLAKRARNAKKAKRATKAAPLSLDTALFYAAPAFVCLHLLFICFHATLGGWHFGHRYTVDALPVLLLGLSAAVKRCGEPRLWPCLPLFTAGAFVNLFYSALWYAPK